LINTANNSSKLSTGLNSSCDSLISDECLTYFHTYHYLHYLLEFLESDESDSILLGIPDNKKLRKPKDCDFFRRNRQISVIQYCLNPNNHSDNCLEHSIYKLKKILEKVLFYGKNLTNYLSFSPPDISSCNYDAILNICDSLLECNIIQNLFSIPEYSFKKVKDSFYQLLKDYPEKKFNYNLTLDNFSLPDIEGLSFMFMDYPCLLYDAKFHILLSTAISIGVC
jgi:hypothetical protein